MGIFDTIRQLADAAEAVQLIEAEDKIYARNRILSILQLDEYVPQGEQEIERGDIPGLLDEIVAYAAEQGIIGDADYEEEMLTSRIMDCFLSKPSEINQVFYEKYKVDPKAATDYFYQLSQNSTYIQMRRLAKNIRYKVGTEYGELDITINLSKPEKDPKTIALEKTVKKLGYPTCLLCVENEGYAGRIGHPARANHRMIRVNLESGNWLFQYSPYLYYNEHSILLAEEHRDMKISRRAFSNLLEFTGKFPHYFIGSNADLPIVGGSILSHDHYQAGQYTFAMAEAEEEHSFALDAFPDVQAATIKWPMSVIRLRAESRETLADAAEMILDKWKRYSDPTVGIEAFTGQTPHNTITPIARMRNNLYELDLVLRNNRTDEAHPLGIFHPHEDVQHIKKENIGLIEVMGLAVLPARLKDELREIANMLAGKQADVASYHLPWAKELAEKYHGIISEEEAEEIIRQETGKKFLRVLEDAGVFKRNGQGSEAFRKFITALNG